MILLVKSGGEDALPEWRAHFAEYAPHLDVRWWDDASVPSEAVRYVLVWEPQPGRLAGYPNLRLICSSAAGVDHITTDPDWPRHLPVVRMAEPETAQRMGEYVCLGALALLRDARRIAVGQARGEWDYFEAPRTAAETRAGILGLGHLGRRSAEMLRDLGFSVAGWSASRKSVPGVESFCGDAELDAFLARTDILVCLLPQTPATIGILCARTLSRLPRGAGVVNAGRGAHVVIPDLVAALDSGHLGGAVLDVFEQEPLPADDRLWRHPKIIVTPHLASSASRRARARAVAAAIAAFERGEEPDNLFRPERGY